jgi:RNA:NAD 2'-phosphotransferase (TPT1/KptA family)
MKTSTITDERGTRHSYRFAMRNRIQVEILRTVVEGVEDTFAIFTDTPRARGGVATHVQLDVTREEARAAFAQARLDERKAKR